MNLLNDNAFAPPNSEDKRKGAGYHKGGLPGFGLTFGFAVTYLSLIVLLPLSAALWKTTELGLFGFWSEINTPRVLAALRLSFLTALGAAVVNAVVGTLLAWVLVRYSFPGRRFIDAAIDLPFALPTAVAGIALTAIYAPNGWLGGPLAGLGLKIAFAPPGIIIALIFIGLPFVVRTVQPVLDNLEEEIEEAAAILGATRLQTLWKVVLPTLHPAILTGFTLAFARGVGEYGSVVFISGNMPMRTEIAPLLIVTKLEQYEYAGATAIAVAMLGISFVSLLLINLLQRWTSRRAGQTY
ncbi:MAG: sulfate ABC transporter permease subunit CysT [Oceanipulchritudo sp.]